MPKRHRTSTDARHLIETIVRTARAMKPPIPAAELAQRVQITPATLSRMKKDGRGDIAVITEMARVVGMKIALVPDDETLNKLQTGRFFDD